MIDKLMKSSKITPEQYKDYQLFCENEQGRNWLADKMKQTFMETPKKEFSTGVVFAFQDGRRALLREISANIDYVYKILKEDSYVGTIDE